MQQCKIRTYFISSSTRLHGRRLDSAWAAAASNSEEPLATVKSKVPSSLSISNRRQHCKEQKVGKHQGRTTSPISSSRLPRQGKTCILNIYNSTISLRYFPTNWKHAVVVPMLKPHKMSYQTEDNRHQRDEKQSSDCVHLPVLFAGVR